MTVNSMLSSLNAFCRFMGWDLRVRFVRIQRRLFREERRELSRAEYSRLLAAAEPCPRVRLLLETICSTGIRVSEVRYITVEAARTGRADIHLKGKIRTILLPDKLCRRLLKYAGKQKIASGEIFLTEGGGSMGRQRIRRAFKRLCAAAGAASEKVFPHNLRHLFAVTFYRIYKDVALSVPVTVGNEAAEKTGSLQWIFTVQEEGGAVDPGGTGGGPTAPDDSVSQLLNCSEHFAYIIGYEDGNVHPNADITRGEVATIFFRLLNDDVRDLYLCTWNPFRDMGEDVWCNTAVSTLYNLGILRGRTNGSYDYTAPITRAEFAAIATRFSHATHSENAPFSDIHGHWAEEEINEAAELGWVRGLPDGTFQPERPITRAEAMALVNRVLDRMPETEDDLLPDMRIWTDNRNKSAWYYLDVQEATNSHDFSRRTNEAEHWTKLTPPRDWKQYEVPSYTGPSN